MVDDYFDEQEFSEQNHTLERVIKSNYKLTDHSNGLDQIDDGSYNTRN